MTPEEIQRKAEEQRQKQQKLQAKKDAGALEKILPPFQPLLPESRKIFNLIHPGFSSFPWLFLYIGFGVVSIGLYYGFRQQTIEFLYAAYVLWGIGILWLIQRVIRKTIAYTGFKQWRQNLGFDIKGWEKIGQYEDFPRDGYWILEATVEVKLKNTSPEMSSLVSDALFLFTVQANKCFYEPDFVQSGFSGEIRKEWKMFKGDLSTKGSADRYVLGRIYQLCHIYLRSIHGQYAAIESVTVHLEGKPYHIRRVDNSD